MTVTTNTGFNDTALLTGVNATEAGDQTLPSLIRLPDGGSVVSYFDAGAGAYAIEVRDENFGITASHTHSAVSGGNVIELLAGADGGVDAIMTGPDGLYLVKYSAAGEVLLDVKIGTVSGDTEPTTASHHSVAATVLNDGAIALAYNEGGSAIEYRVIDATTGATLGYTARAGSTINPKSQADIQALADGGFALSWTDRDITDGGDRVHVQAFNADGSTYGRAPEYVFPKGTAGIDAHTSSDSAIVALPDGKFMVVTSDSGGNFGEQAGDLDRYAVGTQVFNSAGSAIGSYNNAIQTNTNGQIFDVHAGLADNGLVVLTYSYKYSVSDFDVIGVAVAQNGIKASPVVAVDTSGGGSQDQDSRVVISGNEAFFIYRDLGADSDGNGISIRSFELTVKYQGDGGNDYVTGTEGGETLDGGSGFDVVQGLGGNDVLIDGDGGDADILDGGAGDDIVRIVGSGYNGNLQGGYLGGTGTDTLDMSGWTDALFFTLDLGTGGGANTYFAGFENYLGGDQSDLITGSHAVNVVDFGGFTSGIGEYYDMGRSQGAGFDVVTSHNDAALLTFKDFESAVWVSLATSGPEVWTRDTNGVSSGTWRIIADISGFHTFVGSAYGDQFIGSADADTYVAFTTSQQTASGVAYGAYVDIFDGMGGSDTVNFSGIEYRVVADLTARGTNVWTTETQLEDSATRLGLAKVANVENFVGSTHYATHLTMAQGAGSFTGGSANDTLVVKQGAGAGVLTFNGNGGSTLGPKGGDLADFSSFTHALWIDLGEAVEVKTRGTSNELTATGDYTEVAILQNVTSFTGSLGIDNLKGDLNDNRIVYVGSSSVAGIDRIDGGGGTNTADFGMSASAVWVDLDYSNHEAWTRDRDNLDSGTYRAIADLDNITNIVSSKGVDKLWGNAESNVFYYDGEISKLGVERIEGRGGSDTVDFQLFDSAVWVRLGGSGVDGWTRDGATVNAGTWRSIAETVSVENVVGTDFDDYLELTTAGQAEGGKGNDRLIGSTGSDRLVGGAGSNIFDAMNGTDEIVSDTLPFGSSDYDTFLFRSDQAFGTNTIYGFDDGSDRIRFTGTDLDSLAKVQAAASDNGGNVDIVGANGTVTIVGMSAASLSADDFIFG